MYFLYPETSGVRLEDMDLLFGDASTAITPATQGERGSLMGAGSPVPSLDIRRPHGQFGTENAIPGLEINPPNVCGEGTASSDRSLPQKDTNSKSDGFRGWISNMVSRHRESQREVHNSQYKRVGQEEEDCEQ